MNVLSLFDGMSCGRIALERADIEVENYYSAEIDKYAVKIADKNYSQDSDKRLGDVTKWRDWDINWSNIDLVTGGFPCQAWSVAGKGLGDRDERGMLFWTMLDIMKNVLYHNPKAKFLMENVRMKKEFEDYITEHTEKALGTVHKHLINSSLVSAQNRKRFYWTNIEGIEQPEDKGLILKDILEDGSVDRNKSYCLDANYFRGGNLKSYFEKHRRQLVFSTDGLCHVGDADLNGNDSIKRVYHSAGKAPTLTTMGGGHREPKVLIVKEGTKKGFTEINPNECVDLTFPKSKTRRGRAMREKSNCLTASTFDYGKWDGYKYRKLTPLECERLQTVPDNYTEGVSNTQRYKMLGNGWTVDVIAHIFSYLPKMWRCDLDKPCVKFCESNEREMCGVVQKSKKEKKVVVPKTPPPRTA